MIIKFQLDLHLEYANFFKLLGIMLNFFFQANCLINSFEIIPNKN